jgi:hypothetical protein
MPSTTTRSLLNWLGATARIHEQRAAVEMKIQDYDKALADYLNLSNKSQTRSVLNYRAYIYELKRSSKFV